MSPLWILAAGGVAFALSQKKAATPQLPPPPQLPPALPQLPPPAYVPPKVVATPQVNSQLLTPNKIAAGAGGLFATVSKTVGVAGAIGGAAHFLAPGLTATVTSTVSSTATSLASSIWVTVAPFIGLAIFVAFAVVAMIPLVFALVGVFTWELRRPGAEFQETYKLAMQMKESITLQMRGDALKGIQTQGGNSLSQAQETLIIRLRDIWLTEFINQWNACRVKAARFRDYQGHQSSNEIDTNPEHMPWMQSRGYFLSDDDVDTLESIVLYNSEPLTEDQLAWANWPYKQFVQVPSAPWSKVYVDARASGIQENQWKYIVQSAQVFANAQYYLMASQKAKDGLGWISWGPLNNPASAPDKEWWDWTNFMTGARWIPGITLASGCAGVMFDSIDANGDIHYKDTVLRVRASYTAPEGVRPVVQFNSVPAEFQTPKVA